MSLSQLRTIADQEPLRVEEGTLLRAYVSSDDDHKWFVYWGSDGVRKKVHVGQRFDDARDASRLCKMLNAKVAQAQAVPA